MAIGAGLEASTDADVRIAVLDACPLDVRGLSEVMEEAGDLCLLGAASTPEEGLALLRRERVDLLILDVDLPRGSGLNLLRDIFSIYPRLAVMIYTRRDEAIFVERALQVGARGYLSKYAPFSEVIEAIRAVASGEYRLSPRFVSGILGRYLNGGKRGASERPLDALSHRELEVFELIGRGLTTQQIADHLKRSVKTIEAHRHRIREKLHVTDGRDLTRQAAHWILASQPHTSPEPSAASS